ncbi:hypothetical protein IW261DRAFT_1572597 [Armillaria novae-zelandiae]|uniref:Ribonuclease H1 N-terminal domain-containing protein n=1 Tax=Armillaria novae-zelandiae TaxID=153914 RepID=A0AA39TV10_9AGAR|nr:hypothetical protein IW261DRAFT_1572597 [Armillaria novae-zelandiae]
MVTQPPPALGNALADCNAEQLAQMILALQRLSLINPILPAGPSMPQGNNEPSPSHPISSLGDTGAVSGGGGIAIAATTAAASHTGAAVKKEFTQTLSAPCKVASTSEIELGQVPGCGNCPPTNSALPIRPSTPRLPWYMVTVGYEVGVFQGWDQVAPLVLSVSGAIYQRQRSRAHAHAHFAAARSHGDVWIVAWPDEDDEDDSYYYD